MEEKKKLITYEGLKKIEEELEDLKVNKRREIAEKIREAREQGDLSENAEYEAAKEEQGHMESRIKVLEELLKNSEVIKNTDIDLNRVSVGCKVTLLDYEFNEEIIYSIVGSTESDVLQNKISNESPVGAALLGKLVNDEVEIAVPNGELHFKILSIEK